MLRIFLFGLSNRRKQPERYAQLYFEIFWKIFHKNIDKIKKSNIIYKILDKRRNFMQNKTANSQQPTANSQQPTANSQQPTANSQQPTANTAYLNVLRVSACIAVIIYHVFANITNSFGTFLTEFEKYISSIFVNVWLWHVPSFVMISGVIFLDKEKEITIRKLFKKYVLRIILALFIFGVPFAFMEIFFNSHYQFNITQIGLSILNVI
jgi:hypothetical protein